MVFKIEKRFFPPESGKKRSYPLSVRIQYAFASWLHFSYPKMFCLCLADKYSDL
jgi:hypothetical protein